MSETYDQEMYVFLIAPRGGPYAFASRGMTLAGLDPPMEGFECYAR